jgi:hypothetical protein
MQEGQRIRELTWARHAAHQQRSVDVEREWRALTSDVSTAGLFDTSRADVTHHVCCRPMFQERLMAGSLVGFSILQQRSLRVQRSSG